MQAYSTQDGAEYDGQGDRVRQKKVKNTQNVQQYGKHNKNRKPQGYKNPPAGGYLKLQQGYQNRLYHGYPVQNRKIINHRFRQPSIQKYSSIQRKSPGYTNTQSQGYSKLQKGYPSRYPQNYQNTIKHRFRQPSIQRKSPGYTNTQSQGYSKLQKGYPSRYPQNYQNIIKHRFRQPSIQTYKSIQRKSPGYTNPQYERYPKLQQGYPTRPFLGYPNRYPQNYQNIVKTQFIQPIQYPNMKQYQYNYRVF